ncbi:pyridoxamine 5'-phosphate oxidase family protein [Haloarchaeobius sp. DFWS5]|uniref:pyridoxamine 5'-phosphate oxidase family protein n=1 Tax=Haloarchaeobius sp. DFWS5 TaxID=3446114 RepID=UPI003EB8E9C0
MTFALRGDWDHDGVADFLDGSTIPLRLSCRTPGDKLWMLSLWFEYDADAGVFRCATAADADVVRYLESDDAVAFEVSTNDPPYRGVRGQGHASVEPDDEKALLRRLLERYLAGQGGAESQLGKKLLAPERDEVTITVEIDRAYAWDFTPRMSGDRD